MSLKPGGERCNHWIVRIADRAGMYNAARSVALPILEMRVGRSIELPDRCDRGFNPV